MSSSSSSDKTTQLRKTQEEESRKTRERSEKLEDRQAEASGQVSNEASRLEQQAPSPSAPPQAGYPRQRQLIYGVRIFGNTILGQEEIDEVISPFLGDELTMQNLTRLASVLTGHYQTKGYTLARAYVPPQNVQEGVAGIFVLEGRVGKVVIEGNRHYKESILRYLLSPGLKNGIIQPEKIQRALFLLNELPDLKMEAFLQPGKEYGTTDIYVKVKDESPIHETLSFDNFGNRAVGRSRAGLAVSNGNFTGRADELDVKMVAPFPSRENPFWEGDYTLLIDSLGTKLGLTYSNADIILGQSFTSLDIRGTASIWGLTVTRPFVRSDTQRSNLTLAFYAKNTSNFILTNTLNSSDRLREAAVDYNHRWATKGGIHFVDVSATQGLGTQFGGMQNNDPFASRAGISDNFTKLNAIYNYTKRTFGDGVIILRGSGQYASLPLSVTEQYSIGGPDSVHGYIQSEFLGDSGWTLNAEYRHPLNSVTSSTPIYLGVFLDAGYTTLKNPGFRETAKRHLSGAGLGVRASFSPTTILRVDLGFPLDPPGNQTNENPVLYTQFSTQL